MTDSNQRAVQARSESHDRVDGTSAAIKSPKPNSGMPRSLSNERADQRLDGNQNPSVGTSAASKLSEPKGPMPRALSKNHGRKSVRAAIAPAKPTQVMPPTPSQKRSRKAASPAISSLKPRREAPGTSSTKRGRHPLREDHIPHATARPATKSTKPNDLSPGDSSPSGRKTGRRSTFGSKPIQDTSGDNSDGHPPPETQNSGAINGRATRTVKPKGQVPGHSLRDGHSPHETQMTRAVAGDDHHISETQRRDVIATIREIRELWRRRQSWHRTEKSLTTQCSAICRRAVGARGITKGMTKKEKAANKILLAKAAALLESIEAGGNAGNPAAAISCLPILQGRAPVRLEREKVEKELVKLAKALPIWAWVEPIRGVGAGSLAALVGECGDIGSYKSASAVWKRMGLAVINGGRQRRVGGVDAFEHGYSPQRRSVAWNIGGGLIGGMGKGPRPKVGEDIEIRDDLSPYQKQFIRLLRLEVERVTETWNGPEHKREPVEKKGELYESFSLHAANRIKRRIEKQFLAELYGAWRDMNKAMP